MLQYVLNLQPAAVIKDFIRCESPVVIAAMRQTITNMLGTVSATNFFTVTITTVGENMAMLMNTVLLTGYMFKRADERCRLKTALGLGDSSTSTGSSTSSVVGSGSEAQQQQQWGSAGGGSAGSGGSGGGKVDGGGVLGEDTYAPGVQKRVQVSGQAAGFCPLLFSMSTINLYGRGWADTLTRVLPGIGPLTSDASHAGGGHALCLWCQLLNLVLGS